MNIKTKLLLLGILIATSIGFQVFLQRSAIDNISNLKEEALLVAKIETGMLMLRRNEKDFLSRINKKA